MGNLQCVEPVVWYDIKELNIPRAYSFSYAATIVKILAFGLPVARLTRWRS